MQGLAQTIYADRQAAGTAGQADGFADWVAAENAVIKSTFERQAGCTTSLLASLQVLPAPVCITSSLDTLATLYALLDI